jgi:hypothetical protein
MNTVIAALGVLLVLAIIVLGGIGGMAFALLFLVAVAVIGVSSYIMRGRRMRPHA